MSTSIEQRLDRLEAVEAIKEMKYRYFNACDRKDVEAMRDCFAEGEIHIDYGALGTFSNREPVLEMYQSLAVADHIIDMHHGQNPEITIDSETTASAHWALYFFQINTQNQQLTQLAGHYDDKYVKQGGAWCMTSSVYRVHSSYISTMADIEGTQPLKAIFAGCKPDVIFGTTADGP